MNILLRSDPSCNWRRHIASVFVVAVSLCAGICHPTQAQQLEPRAYNNAPTGVNFLSLGYAWSNGNVLLDPAIAIENLDADIHVGLFQFAHSFSLGGDNAKFKFMLPWTTGDWEGSLEGLPASQRERGMGDAWVGIDWLFSGAPALTTSEFPQYEPGRIFGMGLRLSIPTGDYDSSELLNLGGNRWSLRSELSAAQTWGRWTLEGVAGVRVFSKNNDFLGHRTLEQKPIASLKGSAIYSLDRPGWWTSFSLAYGEGGRTSVDGVSKNTKQKNWRFGATFAMPLAQRHGFSLRVNTGINNGAGSDFDSVSLIYTYQTAPRGVQ